jgi:hypothetical protein
VLSYSGFPLSRLRELLHAKSRTNDDLQQFVLSYLAMHIVTSHQPGVAQILAALHFPLSSGKMAEFGDLPITRIQAVVSTSRASDDVIVQSAELSGMDAFEEVVNLKDISNLRDAQQVRLLEIVRSHAPELAPAGS